MDEKKEGGAKDVDIFTYKQLLDCQNLRFIPGNGKMIVLHSYTLENRSVCLDNLTLFLQKNLFLLLRQGPNQKLCFFDKKNDSICIS